MVKIDIPMPKQCHGCRFFWFKGATCGNPGHYLDARCALSDKHNDWYKKDIHGGCSNPQPCEDLPNAQICEHYNMVAALWVTFSMWLLFSNR